MTIVKFLHVSAPEFHPQGVFRIVQCKPQHPNLSVASPLFEWNMKMINPAAVTGLYSKHSRRGESLFCSRRVVDGWSFLSLGPEVQKRCPHVPVPKPATCL